jgi:hypothetical protein
MLTPAQQRVKQELDELKAFGQFHREDENIASSKKHSSNKWFYIIFGIILFTIAFSFLLVGILNPSQGKVLSYLEEECKYNKESAKLLKDDLDETTANRLDSRTEQANLLKKMKALIVPPGFDEHNRDLIAVMEQRLAISAYLRKTKSTNIAQLDKYLLELNVRQELALDSLTKAFANEKIKYTSLDDGSLKYWVNGKSYRYDSVEN